MADLLTLSIASDQQAGRSTRAARGVSREHPSEGDTTPAIRQKFHDNWLSAGLFMIALLYATLRYNVFKGVPWTDWPAYTVNKAIAVGSLLLIAAAVIRLTRHEAGSAILLAWSGVLALCHSLLSFALLNPIYFAKLFDNGKLTAAAGLSLTLGALLLAVMDLGARRARSWAAGLRHAALAFLAFGTGIHAALPSVSSWVEPATWPGGLPPLTLISFLTGSVMLGVWLKRSQSNSSTQRG